MTSSVTITASIPVAQQGVVEVYVAQTQPHTTPVVLNDGESATIEVVQDQVSLIVSEVPVGTILPSG